MTHQEGIIKVLTNILSQDNEVIDIFKRGNPFDKLLRSYDEFNSKGEPLYKKERARNHYKMSVKAYTSKFSVKELYGEHKIPLSVIIKRLVNSDRSYESIKKILMENEVVLITTEEARQLNKGVKDGGCGLRSSVPENGRCRLIEAEVEIAPETINNHL